MKKHYGTLDGYREKKLFEVKLDAAIKDARQQMAALEAISHTAPCSGSDASAENLSLLRRNIDTATKKHMELRKSGALSWQDLRGEAMNILHELRLAMRRLPHNTTRG